MGGRCAGRRMSRTFPGLRPMVTSRTPPTGTDESPAPVPSSPASTMTDPISPDAGAPPMTATEQHQATPALDDRQRWTALVVLCVGMLMIVLDTTVVNVALPSIQEDLGFSNS